MDTVEYTVKPSAGGLVTSVLGRTGDVVATSSDYSTSLVANSSAVTLPGGAAATTATAALNSIYAKCYDPCRDFLLVMEAVAGTATVSAVGCSGASVGVAATALGLGNSLVVPSQARLTAATAASNSYVTSTTQCVPCNTYTWRGSHLVRIRTSSTNWRWHAGWMNAAPTGTDISTFINCIGIGKADGLANVQLFHNDGTGAPVLVDLGASFPASTVGATYRLTVEYTATSVLWVVERLDSPQSTSGSFTADIPAATMQMSAGCTNSTDASAVCLDWSRSTTLVQA